MRLFPGWWRCSCGPSIAPCATKWWWSRGPSRRRRRLSRCGASGTAALSRALVISTLDIKPAVLISLSFDGELIARTIEQLGFLTARGSSTRSGGSGLWALAKAVERGHGAVFTADGPRGPVYKVKPGAVKLAQLTGYAIGIFYAHPEKAWMLRSWDRFLIPKPFSRVAISWGRNIEVPQSEDPLVIEAKRLEVEAALERARLNAERHFAQAMNMQSP